MNLKHTKPKKAGSGLDVTSGSAVSDASIAAQAAALKAISFTKSDFPEKPMADKWHTHKEENLAAIAELDKLALAKDLEGLRRFRSPSNWITQNYRDVIIAKMESKLQQKATALKEAAAMKFDRSYWAVPSKLLAGCYPGDQNPAESLKKLQALADCNVSLIVNLMFANEVNAAGKRFVDYGPALQEVFTKAGRIIRCKRLPIRNNDVPTTEHMREILDVIDSAIAAGEVVFVHCWGGKGRTGTVIGCYLARHGLATGEAALKLLNNLAKTSSYDFGYVPQTPAQCDFVRNWKPESASAKTEAQPAPKKRPGKVKGPAVGVSGPTDHVASDIVPTTQDRILGGLWGAVVGDALGVPVEFRSRAAVQSDPVTDLRSHGTYNQPKGTWSDDSSMMLCTVESLILHAFDPEDMGQRFVQWSEGRLWTPWGKVFDIGGATRRALGRIQQGTPAEQAGGKDESSNGNGSLMRILPIALRFWKEPPENLVEYARRASCVTHAHPRSQIACAFYCLVVAGLLRGEAPAAAHLAAAKIVGPLFDAKPLAAERHHFDLALSPDLAATPESEIGSGGHVIDTLTASLWCLLTSSGYAEAVLKAVNLGEDTDTTGIAAGGLAGVQYGLAAVPERWRLAMARASELGELFTTFAGTLPDGIMVR